MSTRFRQTILDAIRRRQAWLASQNSGPLQEVEFLVVSGGGSDGAFGVGFLNGLTSAGRRVEYEVVTGTSSGALIAPLAFLGSDYDDELTRSFTQIDTNDIIRRRFLLTAIFRDAIADNAPLRGLISKIVDEAFVAQIAREYDRGRLLLIGTANLDAQRPVIWNMGAIAKIGGSGAVEMFRRVMLASAAIPGALPPELFEVEVDGLVYDELHADGGTANQLFFYPLDFNLKAFGDEEGLTFTRRLDVIRNGQVDPIYRPTPKKITSLAARAFDTLIKTHGHATMYQMFLASSRDGVDMNVVYIPDSFTMESKEMFDPAYMQALYALGFELAQKPDPWIHAPPGFEALDLGTP